MSVITFNYFFLLQPAQKWSFLVEFNVTEPSSYFIIDRKADRSNFDYDSLYKGDIAVYNSHGKHILGGCDALDRFVFLTMIIKLLSSKYLFIKF